MRRLLFLTAAVLIMACSGSGIPTVTKVLPLTTNIGNPDVAILGGWPSPYFGRDRLPSFQTRNLTVTDSGGVRYLEPVQDLQNAQGDYSHQILMDTGELVDDPPDAGQTFFDLTDSAIYFRFLPMMNNSPGTGDTPNDQWSWRFQLYDFGEAPGSGDVSPFPFSNILIEVLGNASGDDVEISIFDDDVFEFVDFPYDSDTLGWLRVRHVASGNKIFVDTADRACSGWTNRLEAGPMTNRVSSYTLEFRNVADSDENFPVNAGYIGPLNQQPNPRTLPLSCTIGTPKVITLTRTLPLQVEIGGSP